MVHWFLMCLFFFGTILNLYKQLNSIEITKFWKMHTFTHTQKYIFLLTLLPGDFLKQKPVIAYEVQQLTWKTKTEVLARQQINNMLIIKFSKQMLIIRWFRFYCMIVRSGDMKTFILLKRSILILWSIFSVLKRLPPSYVVWRS